MRSARAGFTLVELVLSIIILGGALSVIYQAIIANARTVAVARDRQDVAYVFSLGELAYPMRDIEDPEEDIPVDPDWTLKDGYCFERTVDEKEEPEEGVTDDRLYTVRTIVTWGDGSNREEIVRYYRAAQ